MSHPKVVLAIEHDEALKRVEAVHARDGLVILRVPAGAYFRNRGIGPDRFAAEWVHSKM